MSGAHGQQAFLLSGEFSWLLLGVATERQPKRKIDNNVSRLALKSLCKAAGKVYGMKILGAKLEIAVIANRYIPNVPVYEMTVPTASTECYSFLTETNLGCGRPTFLAGASGAGKTMLAVHVRGPICLNDMDCVLAATRC